MRRLYVTSEEFVKYHDNRAHRILYPKCLREGKYLLLSHGASGSEDELFGIFHATHYIILRPDRTRLDKKYGYELSSEPTLSGKRMRYILIRYKHNTSRPRQRTHRLPK